MTATCFSVSTFCCARRAVSDAPCWSVNDATVLNRCAHHEPIFVRSLAADWQTLTGIRGLFSMTYRIWVESVSRVPTVLATKPNP